MSDALLGIGSLFKVGDAASPEVFSTVSEVISVNGPNFNLDTIDVTNLSSTNNTKEYIPGLVDPSEITIECNFLPNSTTQAGLRTDSVNRTLRNFQIVWASSPQSTASFAGYVTSWSTSFAAEDKMTLSVTIKVTGTITIA